MNDQFLPPPESILQQYKDLNFKGQQPDESVVCFFRKHWITMLPHFAFFGVFLLLIMVLIFNIQSLYDALRPGLFKLLFIITTTLSLLYIHYFFLKIVEHFLTVTILTNCRIVCIAKSLFVIDEKESCDLKMIQEINKHQNGILPSFLHYGDLSVTLSQSAAILRLDKIPNPEFHFRLINRVKQKYIEDRIHMKINLQEQIQKSNFPAHEAQGNQDFVSHD